MPQTTVKGRAVGAGTGAPIDLTAAQLVSIIDSASPVSLSNVTLTSATVIDLVDTGNALNTGASNPTADPHIAMDFETIQAKASATVASSLQLNPLGGVVLLGTTAQTTSAASGGLQVNNLFTGGGFERVLTVSDLDVLYKVIDDSSTSHVLVLADGPGYLRMDNASANTVTIPLDASVNFDIGTTIFVYQVGTGITSIIGSVTINLPADTVAEIAVQGGVVRLKKVAADTWDVTGDLLGLGLDPFCDIVAVKPDAINDSFDFITEQVAQVITVLPDMTTCVPYTFGIESNATTQTATITIDFSSAVSGIFINYTVWAPGGGSVASATNVDINAGAQEIFNLTDLGDYILAITPFQTQGGSYDPVVSFSINQTITCDPLPERPITIDNVFAEVASDNYTPGLVGGTTCRIDSFSVLDSNIGGDTVTITVTDATNPAGNFTLFYWGPGAHEEPTATVTGLTFAANTLQGAFTLLDVPVNGDTNHVFGIVGETSAVSSAATDVAFTVAVTVNSVLTYQDVLDLGEDLVFNSINNANAVNSERSGGGFDTASKDLVGGTVPQVLAVDLDIDDIVGGYSIGALSTQAIFADGYIFSAYDGTLIDSVINVDLLNVEIALTVPENILAGKFFFVLRPHDNRQAGDVEISGSSGGGVTLLDHYTSRRTTNFDVDFGTVDSGTDVSTELSSTTALRRVYKFTSLSDLLPSNVTISMANIGSIPEDTTVRIALWQRNAATAAKFRDPPDVVEDVVYADLDSGGGVIFQLDTAAGTDGEFVFSVEADRNDIDWTTIDISFDVSANIDSCAILTVPTTAPFDFDFGSPGESGVTLSVAVPIGCTSVTCEFDAGTGGDEVEVEIWTGSASDTGERINVYYWEGDDRVISAAPTSDSFNVNPTGLTSNDGFFNTVGVTGISANNPNILVLTGFESDDAVTVNVKISVLGV